MNKIALAAAAVMWAVVPTASRAQTFGSLANFDAINDTGRPAYGFEIEIDDPSFDHTKIGSVFGLNRDFGGYGGPLGVVRWKKAEIIDLPGVGVKVRYGGDVGSVFTPINVPAFSTPGESCWPGANPNWTVNPCDHFGITTFGSPTSIKYSWLVEDSAHPGTVVPQLVHIPAVSYVYTPPVLGPPPGPNLPPPVLVPAVVRPMIVAEAPPLGNPDSPALWGEAFWVKSIKTSIKNPHDIDLGDLLRGDNGNADLEVPETETEWELFQRAPLEADGPGANEVKEVEVELGDADKSIIIRYEFYKYLGETNPEDGEAICDAMCELDPYGPQTLVGDFVGQQIAGFNAVQQAAIPEPSSHGLVLASLGILGLLARRRGA